MKLYNTISNKIESLQTLEKNCIKIYVCGITPYDNCHIGHARIFLLYDTLLRYLRYRKYKILYIRNITDIDDKIINRALLENETTNKIADTYIIKMEKILKNLSVIQPTYQPKVTNFIKEIIIYIIKLYEKKFAYIGKNGDIYYNVIKNKNYGELSNRIFPNTTKDVNRLCVNYNKTKQQDFVLWKKLKEKKNTWESPFGTGRPGWHIECSTMSEYYLGTTFDIHGGGIDLLFPHHENEHAQTTSFKKNKFAKHWVHIGLVEINNKKMSKSFKNYITIEDILKKVKPEALRYFMLTKNYRKPLSYCEDQLNICSESLRKFYSLLNDTKDYKNYTIEENTNFENDFRKALNNDFNTPQALSILIKLRNTTSMEKNEIKKKKLCKLIKYLCNILGLLKQEPKSYFNSDSTYLITKEEIETLLEERTLKRLEGNWLEADKIRKYLIENGVVIKDHIINTK
jgi:cysteinyl-tRNA synthetase